MSSANRILVEISPYSLQLAIISGRRLVALGDYPLDAKDALAAFLAGHQADGAALVLVSPKQPFAWVIGEVGSAADLLAAVSSSSSGLPPPLSVVACDAVNGRTYDTAMQGPVFLAAATTEGLVAARDQLGALGIAVPARAGLALPAQLGAVVAALQDMSESARVAVLALGENESVLALVSAGGVEAVQSVAVGYGQIFEAVKAELGLKFRAAATKLFFNTAYDFDDVADKIALRLAAPVQAALEGFAHQPTALQVAGLTVTQGWLGRTLGQAVNLKTWEPDMAKICAQLELQVAPGSEPTPNALSLVQLAAAGDVGAAAWLPDFFGDKPKAAVVPAAAKPVVEPNRALVQVTAPAAKAAGAKSASAPAAPRATTPPFRPTVPLPAPNKVPPKPPLKAVAAKPLPKPVPLPAPARAVEIKLVPRPQPVAPVKQPEKPAPSYPVESDPSDALPKPAKQPFGLYGAILAGLLIVAGVGVKKHMDGAKSASVSPPAAEAAPAASFQPVSVVAVKTEPVLTINPETGLPGSWMHTDVGLAFPPGSVVFSKDEFILTGFGRDIGTFKDGFFFTNVPFSGDGAITARIVAVSGEDRVAKIGLMIRASFEQNSEHVSLLIQNKAKNMKIVWRGKTGATTSINDSSGNAVIALPVWLRLVRAGNVITAYQSADGQEWSVVTGTPLTVVMPASAYVGFAVCSRAPKPVIATFDHVSLLNGASRPAVSEAGR